MHSKHCKIRSDRLGLGRATSPMPVLRPQGDRLLYPVHPMPLNTVHQPRSKWARSLHRASFRRHAQKRAVRLPLHRLPPASTIRKRRVPEKAPPKLCALEEETRSQLHKDPPPHQLDLDKFELASGSCNHRVQLRKALEAMHQAVHSLDAKLAKADESSKQNNNNNNNNDETTTNNDNNNQHNNHTDNNNNNNDNNNNKNSRESGLQSFDLDKANPESTPDLDGESLGSFSPKLGGESGLNSLDHQEANLSFKNLGHTMTIGLSLGSFSQNNQDGQKGKKVGTAYSFDSQRAKLGKQKPRKKVTFGTVTLKAYNPACELQNENNKRTTCWDSFQQENAKQQQTATASEKELQHKACQQQQNNSLGREEQILGNIQQACRCPSNMNNSNLGIGTKNTAAWAS